MSITQTARSVSPEKSAWPGVSRRVKSKSLYEKRACLEKMVMPRSFSWASVSSQASPWSTRP